MVRFSISSRNPTLLNNRVGRSPTPRLGPRAYAVAGRRSMRTHPTRGPLNHILHDDHPVFSIHVDPVQHVGQAIVADCRSGRPHHHAGVVVAQVRAQPGNAESLDGDVGGVDRNDVRLLVALQVRAVGSMSGAPLRPLMSLCSTTSSAPEA